MIKKTKVRKSKVKGAMYGMAMGDGLGYPAEFLTIPEIEAKLLPNGFLHANDAFIKVTDDTQMALAVAKALQACENYTPQVLEKNLRTHFVAWLNDPENNRAPGMTCLASCERLEKGGDWQQATDKGSKGCGANMRVLPVGLSGFPEERIAQIAQFQSALTHAHPTALAASELTAVTVHKLLNGTTPLHLLNELTAYAEAQRTVYHAEYLQHIWDRPPFRSPEEFIELGWNQCLDALHQVTIGLQYFDPATDPCLIGGAGWTAEESFATALYCFLSYPNDPVKVLQRAVVTSGDSDSIACLAGGFAGAYLGFEALPRFTGLNQLAHWTANIEYSKELEEAVVFLDTLI